MTFIKDDHSYWQCDRCKAQLSQPVGQGLEFDYNWEKQTIYHLIKTKPLNSIGGSDVLTDYCETCANEILEQKK